MATVTAIIGGEMRYAACDDEIEELVGAVFAESRGGWAVKLFAWHGRGLDRGGTGGPLAGHQLRVVTDLASGWGALNFLQYVPQAIGWTGWDSLNPEHPHDAPELPFGRSPLKFPRNAALPLDIVRSAVREYCRWAERPACAEWQHARYF
jgi:hypothetical protein